MKMNQKFRAIAVAALCVIGMMAGAQENRFAHLVITNDTTLNALSDNYDGITIKNGATLTITNNSFIRIADTSKVYIRNGSKLVVNNSTLSGRKNNLMWGGIIADTNCIVEILNGSIIERAVCGLYMIGTYPYTNRTTIHISNSTFRDCSYSIVAKNYEGTGYVNNNSFEVNSAVCYNNSGHYFNTHIYLFNAIFPQIKGCHFSNSISGDPFGKGIYSKDSYLYVVNLYNNIVHVGQQAQLLSQSSFSGFNYGILANNDAVLTCCVNGALFQNNIYGIKAENVLYASFKYNEISISNTYTNYSNMYGIHLNGCNYYTIMGNDIYSHSTTVSGMTGIYVNNSNKNYHLFNQNVVDKMQRGFWAEGNNATINGGPGLEFLCNSLTNSLIGICVNGYVQMNQGSTSTSAGNTFGSNAFDISVASGYNTLNYYYYGTAPSVIPAILPTINLYAATAPRNCSDGGQPMLQNEDMTPDEWYNSSYSEQQKEQYAISAVSELYRHQTPTDKKHNELLQWYERINTTAAKYAMIELLQNDNRYEEAETVLTSMPLQIIFDAYDSVEYNNYLLFYSLRKAIFQSGRDWNMMTAAERNALNNIAATKGGRASLLATGILEFTDEELFNTNDFKATDSKSPLGDVAFYIDGEWCMQVKDTDYVQAYLFDYSSMMWDSVLYYVYTNSEEVVVDSVVWTWTILDQQQVPYSEEFRLEGGCDSVLDYAQYWCCRVSTLWNGPINHYTYLKARIYVNGGQVIERTKMIRMGDCPYDDYSVGEGCSNESAIYPNPASGVITIEWKASDGAEVRVFAMDGEEMLQTSADGNGIRIETSGWRAGVYVYTVTTAGGVSSGKFIKQ